jgi:hypothetical protein
VYSKEESFTDKSDVFSLAVCLWEMATRVLTGEYFVPYHDQGFKFDFQVRFVGRLDILFSNFFACRLLSRFPRRDFGPTFRRRVPKSCER